MLSPPQLSSLTALFRVGATGATTALSRWLGRPARMTVERVEQLALHDATEVLGDSELPIAACVMAMQGRITGQLILAFDDASGLSLADLLLGKPAGTSTAWSEVERSAAQETANIVGCAYLNSLSRSLHDGTATQEVLPSPPRFTRDYAQSLLQFALMNQAATSDVVFLTETQFHIDGAPVNWNLLFIPDDHGLQALTGTLSVEEPE
jgi:chemotaxis protein CheC